VADCAKLALLYPMLPAATVAAAEWTTKFRLVSDMRFSLLIPIAYVRMGIYLSSAQANPLFLLSGYWYSPKR
jgi:hypothetical protein